MFGMIFWMSSQRFFRERKHNWNISYMREDWSNDVSIKKMKRKKSLFKKFFQI